MSSTEPPAGSVPPDPNTPPASSTPPPPPPPPPSAPQYGVPPQTTGVPRPGELADRFVARLIDLILVGIVGFIINLILAAVSDSYVVASFISAIVDTVIYLGYFGFLESSRGQTLGKQVMKLKVFGPDGQSLPTMQEAIKRNIWLGVAILGIIPILGPILAFIIYVVSVIVCAVNINGNVPDRRTWFDKFAGGTEVMKIG